MASKAKKPAPKKAAPKPKSAPAAPQSKGEQRAANWEAFKASKKGQ